MVRELLRDRRTSIRGDRRSEEEEQQAGRAVRHVPSRGEEQEKGGAGDSAEEDRVGALLEPTREIRRRSQVIKKMKAREAAANKGERGKMKHNA